MTQRKEGTIGGDGATSPFGDGKGAPQAGSGRSDGKWTCKELSAFPSSGGPGNPGRDMSKTPQPAQPSGEPKTTPPGGLFPFKAPGSSFGSAGTPKGPSGSPQPKPYKNAR